MSFVQWGCSESLAQLPAVEVLFTDPTEVGSDERDAALLLRVQELIRQTPAGEEITVCVFKFGIDQLAEDLINAEQRGVKVRVILNDGETSKEVNEDVSKILKKNLEDYHFIENDISDKGIIHNKFLLFSEVKTNAGAVSHVVVQTSSNFQKKGTKK
ncbi:MAG: phospholipase D-like domain-containing protein, partial [Bacteroidota bacterium]